MSQYANLNQKLKNIFQIDRPDLDFGIYRILNARRKEISDYLDNRLKQKVEQYLDDAKSDVQDSQLESLTSQLKAEFGNRAFDDNGNLVDEEAIQSAIGQQYVALSSNADNSVDKTQVYSHLYTFFSRYYDEGDFISQRRYKGDTYAIPYSGEEVMLHWANKDQYYTKSGEMFNNYRIRFNSVGEPDKSVLFRLLSADTAKDNQKDNDKNRRFIVLTKPKTITRIDDDGEEYEETIHPIELSEDGSELTIWFEYAVISGKTKQDKLNEQGHDDILSNPQVTTQWAELMTEPAPTEKQPERDLLSKHLNTYTQKNTADYFIHKDLDKFLSNELDFYIKNEVMHLDDVVNSASFLEIERKLAMIKCLRKIGQELIDFLASLENFQKKLWLKKKFVVSSHYCITLDRVDEELYAKIASNPEQWQQWEDLGFKVADDSLPHWGSTQYLEEHPYLMVDTSLFDLAFKASLVNSLDDLDEQTDGLIIHGDNFQALNLLKNKYKEKVQGVYIDPPYNTGDDGFIYKDKYKSSSWLSMLNDRLSLGMEFLSSNSIAFCSIGDQEQEYLSSLIRQNYQKSSLFATLIWEKKKKGSFLSGHIASMKDYVLCIAKDISNFEGLVGEVATGTETYPCVNASNPREIRKIEYGISSKYRESDFTLKSGSTISAGSMNLVLKSDLVIENNVLVQPLVIEGNWRYSQERMKEFSENNELYITQDLYLRRIVNHPRFKRLKDLLPRVGSAGESDFRAFDIDNLNLYGWGSNEDANDELFQLLGSQYEIPYPKPSKLITLLLASIRKKEGILMDFYAGSGTSAHSVINLNRVDGGNRKYLLIEQGEYFDTVLKPRIQKVVYSSDWKNGKPTLPKKIGEDSTDNPYHGISHCLKVIKLESYEDTLNNLELSRSQTQEDLFAGLDSDLQDDYLMHYMLDIESKDSLLNVKDFNNPFDYQLKVSSDSAGAYTTQNIDLIDTFNYLLGLSVKTIDYQLDRGYVQVVGHLRNGELVTVFWRDCDKIGYEALEKTLSKLRINALDSEYKQIFINGDHNIITRLVSTDGNERQLKVRSIEQVFLERMFAQ